MIDADGPNNLDMFGTGDADHARALETLEAVLGRRWEGSLGDLLRATQEILAKVLDASLAQQVATEVVLNQADMVGGGQFYFPKAAEMRRAMRDAQMAVRYHEQGWTISRLRAEYGLTDQAVYAILARQKAIRRRAEPDLFGFGEGEG